MRHLTERVGEQAERQSDMMAEFSIPTWMLLNALEGLGYKVMRKNSTVSLSVTRGLVSIVFTIKVLEVGILLTRRFQNSPWDSNLNKSLR